MMFDLVLSCAGNLRGQLRRNGHAPEWADVCAARVAVRHQTNGSFRRCPDDAHELTEGLARIALAQRPPEHAPMHTHMLTRGGLPEHVRAFEMMKLCVALDHSHRGGKLVINSRTYASGEAHSRWFLNAEKTFRIAPGGLPPQAARC